jgi:predicted nucleic acid-binding protein
VIILDTNVISEVTREQPYPGVLAWLDGCDPDELSTTSITVAELLYGVELLPEGRRKASLLDALVEILEEGFEDRVEPFDVAAARIYARLAADRRRAGRPIDVPDGQIAAICRSVGATLATRNVDDFVDLGIDVVNPWETPAP